MQECRCMVPKMGGDCSECPNNNSFNRTFFTPPRPTYKTGDDEIKALSDFLDKKIAEIKERQESKWKEVE